MATSVTRGTRHRQGHHRIRVVSLSDRECLRTLSLISKGGGRCVGRCLSHRDTMPERARPLLRAMVVKAGADYIAAPLDDPPVASIATPYRLFPRVRGLRSNVQGRS